MVANFESTMLASDATSASTNRLVDKTPDALLCTKPLSVKLEIVAVSEVILLVEKLPDASLATIELASLEEVAVVALLETLPAVEMVSNFESEILESDAISESTKSLEDKSPLLLHTTPVVVSKTEIVTLLVLEVMSKVPKLEVSFIMLDIIYNISRYIFVKYEKFYL